MKLTTPYNPDIRKFWAYLFNLFAYLPTLFWQVVEYNFSSLFLLPLAAFRPARNPAALGPSISMHWATLDGFAWNLILENFRRNCEAISVFICKFIGLVQRPLYPKTYMHICSHLAKYLFVRKMFQTKIVEKNETRVRFEVSTAVTMMIVIFWEMTPCGSYKNRTTSHTS
jgi:hypothetical protein